MSGKTWTVDELRALGVRVDALVAVQIRYGVGRTKGYSILRNPEQLDFRVTRVPGKQNRSVVATSELIRLLCVEDG